MKTNFVTTLAAVLVLTSTAFAGEPVKKETKSVNENQIMIRVDNRNNVVLNAKNLNGNKRSTYVLKVYDAENGNLVYNTTLSRKNGISQAFDISEFEDGKFNFAVCRGFKTVYTKEIEKSTQIDDWSNEQLLVSVCK